jgi:hypothetical protein
MGVLYCLTGYLIEKDMEKKYLKFYKKCMKAGSLPDDGLCLSLIRRGREDKKLALFEPTSADNSMILVEGTSYGYWASGLLTHPDNLNERMYGFTPLRQTIVLFLAAMNNEL